MKCKHVISAHKDLITSCKFLFTYGQAATSSMDKSYKLWDLRTGQQARVIQTGQGCFDMQVSTEEMLVATAHSGMVKMWDLKSRQIAYQLLDDDDEGDGSESQQIQESRSSRLSLTAFRTGTQSFRGNPICSIRFTNDDLYLTSLSRDGKLKVWDLRKQQVLNSFEHERLTVGSNDVRIGLSRNNQFIACGSKDGSIIYYDIKSGEVEDILTKCHKSPVVACEWQPRCDQGQPTMVSVDSNGCFIGWCV
jgi:WD40 repeat protein